MTVDTPPEARTSDLGQLLESYARALQAVGEEWPTGQVALRLLSRRIRRATAALSTRLAQRATIDPSADDTQAQSALERFLRALPAPWPRALIVAAIAVVTEVIISLAGSMAESQRLLDAAIDIDPGNPASVVAVLEAIVQGNTTATMFLAWTILAATSLVLLPMLPGAIRYRRVFTADPLHRERHVFEQLRAPAPRAPTVDLRILAVPAAALLFVGLHLIMMVANWPLDDGRDGARVVLATIACGASAVFATVLAVAFHRRSVK